MSSKRSSLPVHRFVGAPTPMRLSALCFTRTSGRAVLLAVEPGFAAEAGRKRD